MSSSPRLAPAVPAGIDHSAGRDARRENVRPGTDIQPFPYDAVPTGAGLGSPLLDASGKSGLSDQGAAEAAARLAQSRSQGREEGRAEARQQCDAQLARERASVAAALAEFARDRAGYFQKIENEVVGLALSIARQILHREAQLDPLLLAGIVRVALEKIAGATTVRLRLHPQNAADWRRYLSTHLGPSDLPQIEEDPLAAPDCCVLETSMGTSVVGIEVQLKEIERGLADLLAARPGPARESLPPGDLS